MKINTDMLLHPGDRFRVGARTNIFSDKAIRDNGGNPWFTVSKVNRRPIVRGYEYYVKEPIVGCFYFSDIVEVKTLPPKVSLLSGELPIE